MIKKPWGEWWPGRLSQICYSQVQFTSLQTWDKSMLQLTGLANQKFGTIVPPAFKCPTSSAKIWPWAPLVSVQTIGNIPHARERNCWSCFHFKPGCPKQLLSRVALSLMWLNNWTLPSTSSGNQSTKRGNWSSKRVEGQPKTKNLNFNSNSKKG